MTGKNIPDITDGRHELVIRNVLVDGRPASIAVGDDGRIAAIGEDREVRGSVDAEFSIDADGAAALPGFANTHTHAAMTLLRGYADDMPLSAWLSEKIWPLEAQLTGEDVYWGTRLACLEMIRSGTLAFNDMYFFMEEAARAVADAGIRAQLSYGFIDLGDPDKREKECRATESIARHIRGLANPRITAAVGPHAVYTVSPEGLRWCAEFAREEGLGIHVHLAETEGEVLDCLKARGMRPAQLLDRTGCLADRTIAAHCCWLDRAECGLLALRGAHASYNPTSNMKLAVNRALPLTDFKAACASVTLGTDGCASNNNLDMFEAMKFGSLLQKFSWNSQTLLSAGEAVAMATTAGARAMRLPTEGRIAEGGPADIVLVPRRAVCMTPLHSLASNLVYACSGACVETVLCDGRVLMAEGVVPGEEEVREQAAKAAESLVHRAVGRS